MLFGQQMQVRASSRVYFGARRTLKVGAHFRMLLLAIMHWVLSVRVLNVAYPLLVRAL